MKKLFTHSLVFVLTAIAVSAAAFMSLKNPSISAQETASGGTSPRQKVLKSKTKMTSEGLSKQIQAKKISKTAVRRQPAFVRSTSNRQESKPQSKPLVEKRAVNNEAIKEIENIREQLGIAIFPNQKGSTQFNEQLGKLMSKNDSTSVVSGSSTQTSASLPSRPRKATQADFAQSNSGKRKSGPVSRGSSPPSLIPNRTNEFQHGPKHSFIPNRISKPATRLTSQALNVESKVQQTLDVLHDTVGELDKTALAFERAGEDSRADVFRQLSKTLREQIVETKLVLKDADKPKEEESDVGAAMEFGSDAKTSDRS